MGTARLNVWVTQENRPDRIMSNATFVHVLNLDGTVLEWCDQRFTDLPAKCGHIELEVPPGCYAVCASADTNNSTDDRYLGNHLTHIALVSALCDQTACVKLFNPTMTHCFTWFQSAVQQATQGGRLDREVAGPLLEALDRFGQELRLDRFTRNTEPLVNQRPWQ
ncbi:hypothetical protein BH24ACT14_BH24ACT14_18810 [soil metagenome]